MSDELEELKEHAEHGAHHPEMAPVSLTMAILAVMVAVATLLGHRSHTEEVVLQTVANDQWAYYQGKDTRLHNDQKLEGVTDFISARDPAKMAEWQKANLADIEKYRKDKDEIQKHARELEDEASHERRRANRYDFGEVFLEIGLVVTSITLLSGRRMYWYAGMLIAAVGVVVGFTAIVVH